MPYDPAAVVPNMRQAREMVLATFGVLATTEPVETDYTVGTTAVLLGSQKFRRLGYWLSNTGTVNVAIGFSPNVTITTGVLLVQGGFLFSTWYYDLELVERFIWAIGASSGATLHMVENGITGA